MDFKTKSRNKNDDKNIYCPQSTNNRYIYMTRNPLIHLRPHSASTINTSSCKNARIRRQSLASEQKSSRFEFPFKERKNNPLMQLNLDPDLKINTSIQETSRSSQKTNILQNKQQNKQCYQKVNDLFIQLKAFSRKNNDQNNFNLDKELNLYNVTTTKENITLDTSKMLKVSKDILNPFKNKKELAQLGTLSYQYPILSQKEKIKQITQTKRKSFNIFNQQDTLNYNNSPSTRTSQNSPFRRTKLHISEFDIFQKQTFFEKTRLKFGTSQILSMKYSSDDKYLAFSQSDGRITIFNDNKGDFLKKIISKNHEYMIYVQYDLIGVAQQTIKEDNPCNSVRWNPVQQKHHLLEGFANGGIYYRKIKSNHTNQLVQIFDKGQNIEEQGQTNENNSINCLEFMPSGQSFLSGSSDSNIRQYDVTTGQKTRTLKYHKNRVFAIKNIDDNCFLSSGWDNTVFLYDLRSQKVQKYIYGPMIFGDSLDFHNYQVLCGSWREYKQLEIYDLRNDQSQEIKWENISKNETQQSFVYCCQFSKVNSKHIVAGSTGKYELRVFDREDNNICIDALDRTLTKGVFSLDFRNNSNHLSFGTSDANYGLVEII